MSWLLKVDETQSWAYWDDAFSPAECERIKKIAFLKNKERGNVSGDVNMPGHLNASIRNNSVIWLTSQDDINFLYQRLTIIVNSLNDRFFKFHLSGFCEPLQFTEYQAPGEFYKKHIDKMLNGSIRKLSLILQLTDSDEYEGSDLLLYTGEPQKMTRKQGSIIVFPSYVLHEVTPITQGTRHSLVAWIAGDPFK
jgi:PKHD-type hydroxylase